MNDARTEDQDRPNPEELLRAVSREESELGKGRLKIFLGMAAGVGKTYSMLEEAQLLQREGEEVYVGIVETHGREETAKLLEGLKNIPLKKIHYKGKEFKGLDLDAIIALRPQLVLVDELAHSNIPESRHDKRWEDVVEIIENGINVYTTLNVQHIESLNDLIESITGVSVKETVPDSIVEKAASIQLVDITPEELLVRLKEGKVYLGDQSHIAAQNFFQRDRLTALREIVLRFTAEKVDHDLHGMIPAIGRVEGWKAREKLLVAVGSSPHSQKLIRATRRIAFRLDASWIAVYVNDGKMLSESDNNQLERNLGLARRLGAEVITTSDPSVADAIHRIARQRGATQIVIGRPARRKFFNLFQKSSLLEHLAIQCINTDIHVIGQEKLDSGLHKQFAFNFGKIKFLPYFISLVWVLCLAGMSRIALPSISSGIVGPIFLLGILFLSLFFGKGPILFASILWGLIWNFLFLPASDNKIFSIENATIALYLFTAITIGILIDRAKKYKEILEKREETVQAFYGILRTIVTTPSTDEMLKAVQGKLTRVIDGAFEIVLKKIDGGFLVENSDLVKEEKEKNAAIWAFENEQEAGWSTSTLPMSKNLYIPMRGYNEVVGLLVYTPKTHRLLNTEQRNFIHTVGQQLAHYMERMFSEERARESERMKQAEKIYHTVLKSISDEFQHPLSAIQETIYEAFQALKFEESTSKKRMTPKIVKMEKTSLRMQRMMDNVTLMTKLSSGPIHIKIKPNSFADLIDSCLEEIHPLLENREIVISIQQGLPSISFDFTLMEALLMNLLRNAIDYSPPDSKVEIEIKKTDSSIVLSISDEGTGIPLNLLDTIFDEFFRIPGTGTPGMGLGLTISKRIAEIHGGYLLAENRTEGGAKFSFYIPI